MGCTKNVQVLKNIAIFLNYIFECQWFRSPLFMWNKLFTIDSSTAMCTVWPSLTFVAAAYDVRIVLVSFLILLLRVFLLFKKNLFKKLCYVMFLWIFHPPAKQWCVCLLAYFGFRPSFWIFLLIVIQIIYIFFVLGKIHSWLLL